MRKLMLDSRRAQKYEQTGSGFVDFRIRFCLPAMDSTKEDDQSLGSGVCVILLVIFSVGCVAESD